MSDVASLMPWFIENLHLFVAGSMGFMALAPVWRMVEVGGSDQP